MESKRDILIHHNSNILLKDLSRQLGLVRRYGEEKEKIILAHLIKELIILVTSFDKINTNKTDVYINSGDVERIIKYTYSELKLDLSTSLEPANIEPLTAIFSRLYFKLLMSSDILPDSGDDFKVEVRFNVAVGGGSSVTIVIRQATVYRGEHITVGEIKKENLVKMLLRAVLFKIGPFKLMSLAYKGRSIKKVTRDIVRVIRSIDDLHTLDDVSRKILLDIIVTKLLKG